MIFAINPSVVVYTYRRISRRPFVVIVRATKKDKRDSVFYTIEPGSSSCHARVQPRHTRVCIPMQSACDVNGLSVRVLLTPTSEAPEYSRMLIPRHCRFRRQSRLFVISLSWNIFFKSLRIALFLHCITDVDGKLIEILLYQWMENLYY